MELVEMEVDLEMVVEAETLQSLEVDRELVVVEVVASHLEDLVQLHLVVEVDLVAAAGLAVLVEMGLVFLEHLLDAQVEAAAVAAAVVVVVVELLELMDLLDLVDLEQEAAPLDSVEVLDLVQIQDFLEQQELQVM
jgi:hypothetical protein